MIHRTIKKVTDDIDGRFHFNTAIAAIMELFNALSAAAQSDARSTAAAPVIKEGTEAIVVLLAPFVPHVANELWEELGRQGPVFRQTWPAFDPELAREEEAEMPVQINGKLRGRIYIPFGASRELTEQRALADDKIQQVLQGKQIVKIIVIPDKLVNIVAKG